MIELAPEWSDAYYRLAIVQDRLGRPSDAFAALERGLAVSPDDVDLLAELAWLLATASEPALRDAARALSVAQRAVGYSNGLSIRAREALAAAQSANGDPAAAVDTIRKLLADDRLAIPAETRTRITDRMRGLETAHLAPPEQ